ncbi:RDD family protein [Streptomyces pseudogriseolus]|uniref:RDD family protein n=1 Tax=Streptomyces pseudogriseolus TaxID=36817 RepID=UPI003FA2E5FC
MTTEPPPGSGQQPPDEDPFRKQPPDDDPFRKQPPPGAPGPGSGSGSPYDTPGGGTPPPGQGGSHPYEGGGAQGPYGGGPGGPGGPYGGGPGGPGGPYGGGPGGPGGPYGGGPGGPGGPYGGGPGGGPYGGGPGDPLAGMPPLADSGRRTLARIIDMILVGIVVWLLTWPVGVSEYDFDGDDVNVGSGFAQSVIAAALYIAYDTFMAVRYGRTLGKKWLGMRVANLSDGSNPSVQTALVRAAVLWLPFAFCCACVWTAISGGWSYFDRPYKQGLHDKAARTVVVTAR